MTDLPPIPIHPPWVVKPTSEGWWWYRDELYGFRHIIRVEDGGKQYDPITRSLISLPENGSWCGPIIEPPDWEIEL